MLKFIFKKYCNTFLNSFSDVHDGQLSAIFEFYINFLSFCEIRTPIQRPNLNLQN